MKVRIVEDFDGYPDGDKEGSKPRRFIAGQQLSVPDDIPEGFAEMIVGKGHAKAVSERSKADKE